MQFSAVAFHPDGQHVAADRNRTNVVLWGIWDGVPAWETLGCQGWIYSIAFSPDGTLVVTAGGIRGADIRIRIIRASDGQPLESLTTRNTYGVRQLAFSPDGKWLAAGCSPSFEDQVEIWRVADWTRVHELPVHSPVLAYSPDGTLLVTLRWKAMDFWRMSDGQLLHSFSPPTNGDYSPHLSLAISPKSDRIVTGNSSALSAIHFPMILDIAPRNGGGGTFSWTGGYDQYQVQRRAFDSSAWTNIDAPTTNHSVALPLDGPGGILRVVATAP
jgi:WD40 repeat protein